MDVKGRTTVIRMSIEKFSKLEKFYRNIVTEISLLCFIFRCRYLLHNLDFLIEQFISSVR